MTKDKALKLALEALEELYNTNSQWWQEVDRNTVDKIDPAITAIKEALAQPVQEPQYEYLIDDLAEWKQYVEVDSAPFGLREHVTKVLLSHNIKEQSK